MAISNQNGISTYFNEPETTRSACLIHNNSTILSTTPAAVAGAIVALLELGLNFAVAASNVERAICFAASITADIFGRAVIALLAIEGIENAIATARWNIGAVKTACAIRPGVLVFTIVTDLANGRRNDAIAAARQVAFGSTHVFVGSIAVVAFFALGHDAIAATGDPAVVEAFLPLADALVTVAFLMGVELAIAAIGKFTFDAPIFVGIAMLAFFDLAIAAVRLEFTVG